MASATARHARGCCSQHCEARRTPPQDKIHNWQPTLYCVQRRRRQLRNFIKLQPRDHAEVWRGAWRMYKASWILRSPSTDTHDPSQPTSESQRLIATLMSEREKAGQSVVDNAVQAKSAVPVIARWASDQLFLIRLTIRAFLGGYTEGKAEAESRDWGGIQSSIFEAFKDTNVAESTPTPPSDAAQANQSEPAPKVVAAVVLPQAVTMNDVVFVRKRRTAGTKKTETDKKEQQ